MATARFKSNVDGKKQKLRFFIAQYFVCGKFGVLNFFFVYFSDEAALLDRTSFKTPIAQ